MLLREVLRRPDVTPLLLASVVGRFPLGMVPLALVLHVRNAGGDYGAAGALAGCWSLGLAVGTPLLGRALDRLGPTPVLLGSAVVSSLAFLAVVLLPTVPALPALAAAAVAGAATPPLEPALRALWPGLVPADGLERAYSVVGPVVVAVGVALAPAGGLGLAVALLLTGTAMFALRDVVRAWRSAPSAQRHWAGPLRETALLGGYGLLVVVGAGVGVLAVVAAAYGEAAGSSALGPVLVTMNGLGALAGGLAVAVRPALVPRGLPQPLRLPALGRVP